MENQILTHPLLIDSSQQWLDVVLSNFDEFLIDHAANERKASAAAMSLIAHYPDKPKLITEMADLAIEELSHFRQCLKLMIKRNIKATNDEKDPYVNGIIKKHRKGSDIYFVDRLLASAVIEARGAERFALIATHISDPELQRFYSNLAKSEQGHYHLFVDLAKHYFSEVDVTIRWQEWLEIEAEILQALPIRARLH